MSDSGAEQTPWQETKTPDGRVYWYHRVTKQTTWDKPKELRAPEDVSLHFLARVRRVID